MSRLLAALACAGLFATTLSPAQAADVYASNTKYVEVSVKVDDALKAHAGLFEDCAAEGKAWAAKMRAEADKAYRSNPKDFPKDMTWSYDRTYDRRSAIGHYVSVLRNDGTFSGGAHPNSFTDTILWDTDAKKRVSVRPFFNETADNGPTMTALAALVRAAVATERKARGAPDDKMWLEEIKPSLLKLGPITLAPSDVAGKSAGFTLHFSPYGVGSYAEGEYVVFVPWTAFKAYLSPEGLALFEGRRPASDKDN